MKVVRGLAGLKSSERPTVLTIGNFDGVHLGHQRILEQVMLAGPRFGGVASVMLFEPQPREYFNAALAPPRLMGLREKLETLHGLGLPQVVVMPFNEAFRSLTGQAFIERVLCDGLQVQHLVVGDDFQFGCDRQGSFRLLQQEGLRLGFTVEKTETILLDQDRISSTRIRDCLREGQVAEAERLLGRPYVISGRVSYGQQLGRTLGFPTANIRLPRTYAVDGVWAVEVLAGSGRYGGVANIGRRPTVGGQEERLEVHLFDFGENLYGTRLKVRFIEKIRPEKRFDGIEALKAQVQRDADRAQGILSSRNGHKFR